MANITENIETGEVVVLLNLLKELPTIMEKVPLEADKEMPQ